MRTSKTITEGCTVHAAYYITTWSLTLINLHISGYALALVIFRQQLYLLERRCLPRKTFFQMKKNSQMCLRNLIFHPNKKFLMLTETKIFFTPVWKNQFSTQSKGSIYLLKKTIFQTRKFLIFNQKITNFPNGNIYFTFPKKKFFPKETKNISYSYGEKNEISLILIWKTNVLEWTKILTIGRKNLFETCFMLYTILIIVTCFFLTL